MAFLTVRPNFKNGDILPQSFKTKKEYGSIDFKKDSKVTDAALVNTSLSFGLKVTGDVSIDREFNVKTAQLHKKGDYSPYIFYDLGDGRYSFTCTVVMTDSWDYYNLDYLYRNRVPVNIVMDAYAIPNGMYMIAEASKRKVIRRNVWEIELKFIRYLEINVTKKWDNQKKVDDLTQKISKCTYAKWTKKTWVIHSKTKKKVKQDVNDCNKVVTQILNKKGFLNKKFIGTNWEQWYKRKVVKKTKSNLKDTNGNAATLVVKTNKTEIVYPCKVALKKFQKKWNKKKLKPQLKENGKKDKNTLAALKRYKEL